MHSQKARMYSPEARTPWDWPTRSQVLELAFSEREYQRRLGHYQDVACDVGADVLLLYGSPADDAIVRHLTGFSTWWGHSVVIVKAVGSPVLCTSAIAHGEPMHSNIQSTWFPDIRPAAGEQEGPTLERFADVVADALPATGVVGYADRRALPVALWDSLVQRRPGRWIDCSAAVREVRCVKSEEELDLMRRLAALTSDALWPALGAVSSGVSERDIAAVAHEACVRRGAEAMDFGCFALSGHRTIFKNAPPSGRTPRDGDVVVIDLGATLGGYKSDVSRNRFVGQPSAKARRAADACLAARHDALAMIKPGVSAPAVVRAMRKAVADHGLAEWDFSLCHGIGLHLVEAPYFRNESTTLEPGMVFCLEPIVAPPDVGTLCIEDMIAVTETGYELLTTAPTVPAVAS